MTAQPQPPPLYKQLGLPAVAGSIAVCFSHPLELTKYVQPLYVTTWYKRSLALAHSDAPLTLIANPGSGSSSIMS